MVRFEMCREAFAYICDIPSSSSLSSGGNSSSSILILGIISLFITSLSPSMRRPCCIEPFRSVLPSVPAYLWFPCSMSCVAVQLLSWEFVFAPLLSAWNFLISGTILGTEAAVIAMLHSTAVQIVHGIESKRVSPVKVAGER